MPPSSGILANKVSFFMMNENLERRTEIIVDTNPNCILARIVCRRIFAGIGRFLAAGVRTSAPGADDTQMNR